ncbi:MAG: glycosyltransferase, partial [Planctomycetota bacterium]|nr:glycosyltransferase [Planctomycetota bacterium]
MSSTGTGPLRTVRRLVWRQRYGLDAALPSPDLQPVPGAEPGTWQATSDDPQFTIPCQLAPGWIRVRLAMNSEARGFVELCFDRGGGFNPLQRVELAYNRGRVDVDRHLRLDAPVRAIRFDPLAARGRFRIEHFSIETVPPYLAVLRSLRAKVTELSAPGRITRALRIGTGLLLRGQLGEFKRKLLSNKPGADLLPAWDFPVLTDTDRERMRAAAASLPDPPLLSVLLPVYNTPEQYLRLAIESVLKQIYPHWELCIADDCSTASHVRAVLDEYAARDKRIKVVFRPQNGNISAASNSALELATGEYVALLDHDDELAEQALFRMAEAIVADRGVDMLYSDEDKLDMADRHVWPFFKPDWSPEYFLACMYTCHLGVYRTSLVREIQGFRSEFDLAQDYDLVLRLTARTQRIRHIPEVLYHWRITPASTASGATAKPQAHGVAQRALASYLQTIGRD